MGSPLPESTIKHCMYSKTHLSQLPPELIYFVTCSKFSRKYLGWKLAYFGGGGGGETNANYDCV